MKDFEDHQFSISECEKEFKKFEKLLSKTPPPSERADILKFFRKNKNLCYLIGFLNTNAVKPNKLAYEYGLWGDFACDLAIADFDKHIFSFIEFENYAHDSIFKKMGAKSTKEYAPRFEHGFSQIIDWFCKIDGHKNTAEIHKKFGANEIVYTGTLIIGRSQDLDKNLRQRLKWRQENLTIASQKINYFTFDELKDYFREKIDSIKALSK